MPAVPPVPTMLVIDDEPQIRRVVRHALEADHARVLEAASGREGLDLAAAERPELIVLDLGLPDMPGADVCRDIRGWSAAPIVVLSARHSDTEKAALLDLGADDYVTKPFSTIELQARIRSHLRRAALSAAGSGDTRLEADGIVIDLARRSVTRDGAPVHLTPIEWELLRVLATNAGRTLTHTQLYARVWDRPHGEHRDRHQREHAEPEQERRDVEPALVVLRLV